MYKLGGIFKVSIYYDSADGRRILLFCVCVVIEIIWVASFQYSQMEVYAWL